MNFSDPVFLLFAEIAFLLIAGLGGFLLWQSLRGQGLRKNQTQLQAELDRVKAELLAQQQLNANKATETGGSNDYLLGELKHCQLRLSELPKSDIKHAALDMRRRALQAELEACSGGFRRDYALPIALPAYIGIGKDLLAGAGKRQQVLKEKLLRTEAELDRLSQLETFYHDLKQALHGYVQACLRVGAQLQMACAALPEPDNAQRHLDNLNENLQAIVQLLLQGERWSSPRLSPDMAQTLEQGQQLDAVFHQGQRDIGQLREVLRIEVAEGSDNSTEVSQLNKRLKTSESQLREANNCVDTLEQSLAEARGLLKKLVERSRKFQEQDSRLAILEARAKQAEKEVRAWQRLHAEMEARQLQATGKAKAIDKPGVVTPEASSEKAVDQNPAINALKQNLQDLQAAMDRQRYENFMLEEQVIDMDGWRDRAEQAEAGLRRALDEKLMLEQQILFWADDEHLEAALATVASEPVNAADNESINEQPGVH